MRFVFAIQLISCSVLLIIQPVTSYSCDKADWSSSLDGAGWSTCPKNNTYLKGLWRSAQQLDDERVGRIEFGKCCPANETSYFDRPAFCKNADWDAILNGDKVWALCPNGTYLNGLRLGAGSYVQNIDEAQCCHPVGHPGSYEDCYDEDVSSSFDNKGWSECKLQGYYMTGFYKSVCENIYCIENFKCCKMSTVPIGGEWSDWGDWGACSTTCGNGTRERSRTCTSPPPSDGEKDCPGSSRDTIDCANGPCPGLVDRGWNDFGNWSERNFTCGDGDRERRRNCINSTSSNGGRLCTFSFIYLSVTFLFFKF